MWFQELSPAGSEALGASTTIDSRTTETIVGTVFFLDAIKLSAVPQGDPLMRDGDLPLEPAGNSAELTPESLAALFEQAKQAWLAANFDRSEEHTSELQSLMRISYAVFCLKKKHNNIIP